MRDVVNGDEDIKEADLKLIKSRRNNVADRQVGAHVYLPRPNPLDISPENDARYMQYIERAHFYGVTGRTVSGLVGMATKAKPEKEIPERIAKIEKNADGAGLTLEGMAQYLVRENLIVGRGGIFVDFIQAATREDVPTLSTFEAEAILGWFSEWDNEKGASVLKFVLLAEDVSRSEGFDVDNETQVLALSLDSDGYYFQERFEANTTGTKSKKETNWTSIPNSKIYPTTQTGEKMTEIPFAFMGAVCNDPAIDRPVISDLAAANIAHYRNSADYEEAAFLLGQPWPVFENLSRSTIDRLEKDGVYFGSRAPLLLAQGETAKLLQVDPDILSDAAMKRKEAQMVALGAQIMEASVVMTAEQSRNETNATYSQLSLIVKNVSQCITRALEFALLFVRPGDPVRYDLEADFTSLQMDGNTLRAIVEGWQAGAYPDAVKNSMLRKIGATRLTDEEIDDLLGRESID